MIAEVIERNVEKIKLLRKGGRVSVAIMTQEGWEIVLWTPEENILDRRIRELDWGMEEIEWTMM